jgi:isopentenyl-diphosphate delta-isomerase
MTDAQGAPMNDAASVTGRRKLEHLQINLGSDVRMHETTTGFERCRFVHDALPEIALADVDVSADLFGHRLGAPILISSMTGGVKEGWEINRRLAAAAQRFGCAMGVGSQRIALSEPEAARYFTLRDVAPDILLFANLGAVQLNYGCGVDECRRAVEMIEAGALILHLNPLQEALQPEGNRDFSGLLRRIEQVCDALDAPVIVKEVGCGISESVARRLASVGVAAIDVGGAGGTSWSAVESRRAVTPAARRISETFIDWGIPTAESLEMARRGAPRTPLIASGGLRTGLDAAKAIALGADLAGFAGPLLKAAAAGEAEIVELIACLIEELRLAMFCGGARAIRHLKDAVIRDAGDGTRFIQPRAADPIRRAQPEGARHAA